MNFFKTLNFSTLAAFFLKTNAQKEATETVYGDQSVTVAILQIKKKEWKITLAGLTNKWKDLLSQQKTCFVLFCLI